jgi:hypothetical protein
MVPVMSDGALYAWVARSGWFDRLGISNSWEFAFEVMKRARVAISAGRDLGGVESEKFVRFPTASSIERLLESIQDSVHWSHKQAPAESATDRWSRDRAVTTCVDLFPRGQVPLAGVCSHPLAKSACTVSVLPMDRMQFRAEAIP